MLADSTLFDDSNYNLKEGNPKKALVEANSVVLSETLSQKLLETKRLSIKLFGISQGGKLTDYKVTGVFLESFKSHIKANFFTSMTSEGLGEYITKNKDAASEWAGQNFVPSYLKLVPGHDAEVVTQKSMRFCYCMVQRL
ncbi:MAG: hypothetical protein U5K54_13390 [Cytophagales bacterium]|nr:hypothetical protein [Cytophagales bacterium]